jgi:hypothetical protein
LGRRPGCQSQRRRGVHSPSSPRPIPYRLPSPAARTAQPDLASNGGKEPPFFHADGFSSRSARFVASLLSRSIASSPRRSGSAAQIARGERRPRQLRAAAGNESLRLFFPVQLALSRSAITSIGHAAPVRSRSGTRCQPDRSLESQGGERTPSNRVYGCGALPGKPRASLYPAQHFPFLPRFSPSEPCFVPDPLDLFSLFC